MAADDNVHGDGAQSASVTEAARPKRERRKSEVFNVPKPTKSGPALVDGDGKALRDIEYVKAKFDEHRPADDLMKHVHRVIFGSDGQHTSRKRRMLDFKGVRGENEDVTAQLMEKVHSRVERLTIAGLNQTLDLFGLDRGRGEAAGKEQKAERIANFVKCPYDTGRKPPAKIEVKKRKSGERSKKQAPSKRAKKSKRAPYEESDDEDDANDDEDFDGSDAEGEHAVPGVERKEGQAHKEQTTRAVRQTKAAAASIDKDSPHAELDVSIEKFRDAVKSILRDADDPHTLTKRQLRAQLESRHGYERAYVKEHDAVLMDAVTQHLSTLPPPMPTDAPEAVSTEQNSEGARNADSAGDRPTDAASRAAVGVGVEGELGTAPDADAGAAPVEGAGLKAEAGLRGNTLDGEAAPPAGQHDSGKGPGGSEHVAVSEVAGVPSDEADLQ